MASTASAQPVGYEQATTFRRSLARLIDLWLVAPFAGVLGMLPFAGALGLFSSGPDNELSGAGTAILFGGFLLGVVIYEAAMTRLWGMTVGKMALRLRVIDARGLRLSWGRCFIRAIGVYVFALLVAFAFFVTLGLLGFVLIRAANTPRQFPYDVAAGSFVVTAVGGRPKRIAVPPAPADDLERLRQQGIISAEEYARKQRELVPGPLAQPTAAFPRSGSIPPPPPPPPPEAPTGG